MPVHRLHHCIIRCPFRTGLVLSSTGQRLDGSCYKKIVEHCELQNDFTTWLTDVDSFIHHFRQKITRLWEEVPLETLVYSVDT